MQKVAERLVFGVADLKMFRKLSGCHGAVFFALDKSDDRGRSIMVIYKKVVSKQINKNVYIGVCHR